MSGVSKHDSFGLRRGTVRSQAAALYSRPEGATLHEVTNVLGRHEFPLLKLLSLKGYQVTFKTEAGLKNRPVRRYFLKEKVPALAD